MSEGHGSNLKGCGIMEFYAAAVRGRGRKENNTDGVMIKGRTGKNDGCIVMMLCHGLRGNRMEAVRSDKIIRRIALWMDKKERGFNEIEEFCKKLFLRRSNTHKMELTIFIFCNRRFCVMGNVTGKVIRITGDGSHVVDKNGESSVGKMCMYRGCISSGCTFLLSTDNFREYISERELHERLCPQICKDDETMQLMMDDLVERLRERKETGPVSAAALCIR